MNRALPFALIAAVFAVVGAGCQNEPYCFNCADASLDVLPDRPTLDTVPVSDSCVPHTETCNGQDDDCDGIVDNGFDTQTDPANCGGCGMRCELSHALPSCMEGTCRVRSCDVGWYDLDHNPLNGCEYGCTPTGTEICDHRDNDCNGDIDEGIDTTTDVNNCGACGTVCRFDHATPTCTASTCGIGACDTGFSNHDNDASNGCEYACTATGPEVCDGRDNDCDGDIDEGFTLGTDPTNCGACGRACSVMNGMPGCMAGLCVVVACNHGYAPDPSETGANCDLHCGDASGNMGAEVCDGFDNDCNGLIDDGTLAGVGASCGLPAGAVTGGTSGCTAGHQVCTGGHLTCVGAIGPTTEICDSRDNDCDGTVDELPLPGVGATQTCGNNVGACGFGHFDCVSGAIACVGGTGAGTETCNGIDDNCNGQVDEGLSDPGLPHCNARGAETAGVCAMDTRSCGGAAGWQCHYPTTYRNLTDEAYCDGLDNNCDGRVDEGCLHLSTEIRLDQGSGANSIQPMITGATGALGVVYLDRRNGNADIFFNRSTTNGTAWLADAAISHDGTNNNQVQPWLAGTGADFYSNWGDFRSSTTSRQVWGNHSMDLGATWAGTDVQTETSTTDSLNTRVVANGLNVTVVFEALFSDRTRHIDVVVSNDGGLTWPTFARVDHNAAANAVCSTPDVAVGAAGSVYVVWRDNRNGNTDIYFNRSLDNGNTFLAADVRMDTDAAGAHGSSNPSVAADTSNHVFVAWQDLQTAPNTKFDIYTRSSSDRGATFTTANTRADADPIPHDSTTPVALSVQGAFAVAWVDNRLGRTSIYANRSEDLGATWPSTDQRVQTNSAGVSNASEITAATSNGIVFVGWADDRDPSAVSPLDIYANYSLDGGLTYQPSDVRVDGAPAGIDSETPFLYSAGGIGHFVWVDRRADGVNGDIYYRSLR